MIAVAGGKVSLLFFSGKYLDKGTTSWNWYRDMDRREYIAFDLSCPSLPVKHRSGCLIGTF